MNGKYLKCIEDSERVSWKINELLPDDYQFNFDRRFLPKSLTLEDGLTFLSPEERLDLNHIRSASYTNLFAFVEEYITALMVRVASDSTFENNDRLRALLRFSEEEVKHQTLFNRYVEKFSTSFKVDCQFLSGADEVANIILSNSEFSVLLLTYHLELITQGHYLEAVREDSSLDDRFSEILKKHWQEESQHAKLDLYELQRLATHMSKEEFVSSIREYFNIIDAFCGLLRKQTEMDLDSLSKCSGRKWGPDEKERFIQSQLYSYLYNFVLLGLDNKTFKNELHMMFPEGVELIEKKIRSLQSDFPGLSDAP